MKKIVSAFILAAAMALAGCSESTESSQNSEGSSSLSSEDPSQSSFPEAESSDSSSDNFEDESSEENSSDSSDEEPGNSDNSSDSSNSAENTSGVHLSVCQVPAWGVTDRTGEQNVFMTGSEYETYRVLQTTEFENGAVKEIKVWVYVISEDFDMEAFEETWGFEPLWNGSYYEGTKAVPEEYAGMSVEEIKLAVAEPLLKKYGSATYDGFPEIVMVDPTTVPDPAIEF